MISIEINELHLRIWSEWNNRKFMKFVKLKWSHEVKESKSGVIMILILGFEDW